MKFQPFIILIILIGELLGLLRDMDLVLLGIIRFSEGTIYIHSASNTRIDRINEICITSGRILLELLSIPSALILETY